METSTELHLSGNDSCDPHSLDDNFSLWTWRLAQFLFPCAVLFVGAIRLLWAMRSVGIGRCVRSPSMLVLALNLLALSVRISCASLFLFPDESLAFDSHYSPFSCNGLVVGFCLRIPHFLWAAATLMLVGFVWSLRTVSFNEDDEDERRECGFFFQIVAVCLGIIAFVQCVLVIAHPDANIATVDMLATNETIVEGRHSFAWNCSNVLIGAGVMLLLIVGLGNGYRLHESLQDDIEERYSPGQPLVREARKKMYREIHVASYGNYRSSQSRLHLLSMLIGFTLACFGFVAVIMMGFLLEDGAESEIAQCWVLLLSELFTSCLFVSIAEAPEDQNFQLMPSTWGCLSLADETESHYMLSKESTSNGISRSNGRISQHL